MDPNPLSTKWITSMRSPSMTPHKKLFTRRCFSPSLRKSATYNFQTSLLISSSLTLAVWASPRQLQFRTSLGFRSKSTGICFQSSIRPLVSLWRTLFQSRLLQPRLQLAPASSSMLNLPLTNPTVTFSKSHSALSTYWMEITLKISSLLPLWEVIRPKPKKLRLSLERQRHQNMLILPTKK